MKKCKLGPQDADQKYTYTEGKMQTSHVNGGQYMPNNVRLDATCSFFSIKYCAAQALLVVYWGYI